MAQPTREQIIAMLNEDIKGEHAAIIQYLRHAYAMGEGELACEIEAIAREEMYHYKWLSDLVVELGGKPTIERGNLDRPKLQRVPRPGRTSRQIRSPRRCRTPL